MDFLELVTATRACRRFKESEGLPEGTLDWLVNCARLASCAGNAQALRFAVAESKDACAAVFPALKWAAMLKDWDGPAEGERPTGYIVIMGETGKRANLNAIDSGIAAQTIQLAAQSRDIGCCIFLSFNHDQIREVLGIPAEYEPLLVLALGKQKEVRVVEEAMQVSVVKTIRRNLTCPCAMPHKRINRCSRWVTSRYVSPFRPVWLMGRSLS